MADRFYGLYNLPTNMRQEDVLSDTSTQSTDIEVRIDNTKGWNRQSITQALEAIVRKINVNTSDEAFL